MLREHADGDYPGAQGRQAPRRRLPATTFADGMSTTYVYEIQLEGVARAGTGALAWVTFTSLQAGDKGPRPGETCTRWSIDYTLVAADDGLLWIDAALGHAGPISRPCD